ncbi:inositol 2-dehydrogenase [Paratissierella segnis]|uniref:Inositol 2-dehydrogenase n=1 Tax=Paratissierella segnis TaxID=2763679 RepID=A0A926EVT2_9FIRM|nr:inositol 2-dehydrogenase [Paratissierella segnis]MBC8587229.1 inositol 2-dehydrogenase [Paratissierella segnis]
MGKKLKIGIIGAGRIGKLHSENIVNNFKDIEIKAIADIFADKIEDWARSIGIQNIYEDYHDILNDEEIEAVLICSSTNTHARITIEAANRGKHIFCEKPIDFDVNKIKEALNVVNKAGVKFQIGFNRRFDHNFKKVHELVKSGKIGEPHIIKVTSRDPQAPPIDYVKVSGGMFIDMTIHDFDMVRYLSDSEVEEVYTNAAVLVDPQIGEVGDVDTAIISLKFKNGAIGVIDNSRSAAYGYDQRVEVFGSLGAVTVSNDTETTAVLHTVDGILSDNPKYFFLERYKDSFIEEMREFFDSIINDTETPVTGIDGLKPVLIGMAAKKSYEENKPIRLDEITV